MELQVEERKGMQNGSFITSWTSKYVLGLPYLPPWHWRCSSVSPTVEAPAPQLYR